MNVLCQFWARIEQLPDYTYTCEIGPGDPGQENLVGRGLTAFAAMRDWVDQFEKWVTADGQAKIVGEAEK